MTYEEALKQIRREIDSARNSQKTARKGYNQLLEKYAQGREEGLTYAMRLFVDYVEARNDL